MYLCVTGWLSYEDCHRSLFKAIGIGTGILISEMKATIVFPVRLELLEHRREFVAVYWSLRISSGGRVCLFAFKKKNALKAKNCMKYNRKTRSAVHFYLLPPLWLSFVMEHYEYQKLEIRCGTMERCIALLLSAEHFEKEQKKMGGGTTLSTPVF